MITDDHGHYSFPEVDSDNYRVVTELSPSESHTGGALTVSPLSLVAGQTVDTADVAIHDIRTRLTPSATAVSLTEGESASYSVVLAGPPEVSEMFILSTSKPSRLTVNPTTITFTTSNWATAQTFIVRAIDNSLLDGNQTATIQLHSALELEHLVPVNILDNDRPGFEVVEDAQGTMVAENGSIDSFTVSLLSTPASDVVVTVISSDHSEVTTSVAELTFSSANWNVPQTVTVVGVDDTKVDGDRTTNVTIAVDAGKSDDAFDAVPAQIVSVTTTDDDTPGFMVTASGGTTTVDESGTTDVWNVVLTGQPLTDVVLTVSSFDPEEAVADRKTLIFTFANWDAPQTVTVTGVDDSAVDGDQATTVTLSVNDAASDDAFDPLPDGTLSLRPQSCSNCHSPRIRTPPWTGRRSRLQPQTGISLKP
ncbi:MAG TPA: hypothetical protein EYG03_15005 [Planctomycetes bacterium]|nr:hypothetical protein [Planctomycetota bacterium]